MNEMMTVGECAAEMKVDTDKVTAWIKRGELDAFNVTEDESPERANYRITRESWEAFKKRRRVLPSVKVASQPAEGPRRREIMKGIRKLV